MRRRYGVDDDRVPAKGLELEPESRERIAMRLERLGVVRRQV